MAADRRHPPIARLVVAGIAAGVVLCASRRDPVLSADSITYLSAADALRAGAGYSDFTGEPLAHFPPVFPVLLAPGGRSLVWATIVGAAMAAAVAVLLFDLLAMRSRRSLALAGTLVYVLSQAAVRIESTVWSETPYLVLALATLRTLTTGDLTTRRAGVAGALAGVAFLTRYSGAAIVVTGLVVVFVSVAAGGRGQVRRHAAAYLAPPAALAGLWIARNLTATGEPLGPHFEGGAGDTVGDISRQFAWGLGQLVTNIDVIGPLTRPVGWVLFAVLVVAAGLTLSARPRNLLDLAMATFGVLSIAVPIASRVVAGTDVTARLLSPVLVPAVYFLTVVVDRRAHRRAVLGIAAVLAVASLTAGVAAAITAPDRVTGSAGNRRLYAPDLYDVIADLPADADLLTNGPQHVWWHTGREPVAFAFTEPTPGNSHFPLTPDATVERACGGRTYLAWLAGLRNAQGMGPAELRPDLASRIRLEPVAEVPGGTLYALDVTDPADCTP